ncbi:unnamed protein product [Nezara viridula]|uniref:Calx-beta domain-containing protein n=1 Tax=Nezara viridula TaxID=85310 RepID=A0A9P0GZF9_NEZVI|nr:unnamed protein product [Nezara viridula]
MVRRTAVLGGLLLLAGGAAASGNRSQRCQDGLLIPAWRPITGIAPIERVTRGLVYFFLMLYLFIGVSIVSDRFMSAIEVITSQERKVTIRTRGEKKTVSVRVWNETVANLTLMALGSSAPEILLSIIEIWGKNFEAGDLGPGTIVGSAAYNLFVIIAICVAVIPEGETRKIKQLGVFFVTSAWSVFAYIWLYLILEVFSRGVVEVWEGILTFMFFPLTVLTAYMADRKIPIYKLPLMLFSIKSHRAVGAAENVDIELSRTKPGSFEEILEHARQHSANVLKDLRREHPEKTLAELKVMAQERIELSGPKSRAFYRIQATRSLTGGSICQRNVRESSLPDDRESTMDIFDDTTYVRFEQSEYVVLENVGNVVVKVVIEGPGLNVPLLVDYQSEDGTANAGSDYLAVSGTLIFKPGQQEQYFKVKIIDDDVFEEDEHFLVRLSNVRLQGAKANGLSGFKLGEPSILKVTILDDDHSGIFGFLERRVEVSEACGVYHAVVERRTGARGRVSLPFTTQEGTAHDGKDYVATSGRLLFENNESRSYDTDKRDKQVMLFEISILRQK